MREPRPSGGRIMCSLWRCGWRRRAVALDRPRVPKAQWFGATRDLLARFAAGNQNTGGATTSCHPVVRADLAGPDRTNDDAFHSRRRAVCDADRLSGVVLESDGFESGLRLSKRKQIASSHDCGQKERDQRRAPRRQAPAPTRPIVHCGSPPDFRTAGGHSRTVPPWSSPPRMRIPDRRRRLSCRI